SEVLDIENLLADRRAEKQVLRQRRVTVVEPGVELLNEALHPRASEPQPDRFARAQHAFGKARMVRRIDRATQAKFEYGFFQLDRLQDFDDALVDFLRGGYARGLVVGPVGVEVEQSAVGALRLAHLEIEFLALL